jgi:thioredoxin-dependent peroxiredoxin
MSTQSSGTRELQVGDSAPDFTLIDQNGQPFHLHDRIGTGNLVVYFYPRDFTGGCTAEACAFRDSYTAFSDLGVAVIGISADPPESHREFARTHRLPFTLLSDPGGRVSQLYGTRMMFGLLKGRVTFVIDRKVIIRHRFSDLTRGAAHVGDALKVLRALK